MTTTMMMAKMTTRMTMTYPGSIHTSYAPMSPSKVFKDMKDVIVQTAITTMTLFRKEMETEKKLVLFTSFFLYTAKNFWRF